MIISLTLTPLSGTAWLLAWASDLTDPTYTVYRDGVLIATTAAESLVVTVAAGAAPVFEVLDDGSPPTAAAYPATAVLGWYQPAGGGVDYYRIDRYASGAWAELGRVSDDGSTYWTWESTPLADQQSHTFRVVPVGTIGNDGDAVPFLFLMSRYPDPPAVAYAYNSGTGAVTIAAA